MRMGVLLIARSKLVILAEIGSSSLDLNCQYLSLSAPKELEVKVVMVILKGHPNTIFRFLEIYNMHQKQIQSIFLRLQANLS